jgi:twinkle protein
VHRDYDKKNTKVKVLKVKFQNLGDNGAECFFTWEPNSGTFIPDEQMTSNEFILPWEETKG